MALSIPTNRTTAAGRECTVHGTQAFPIGCYYDDLRVQDVPWHWHEELEAALVVEGECTLAFAEEQHSLRAGEGFFINANVLHACRNRGTGACRFHSMSFHPRLVGGGVESVYWQKYIQPLLGDRGLTGVLLRPERAWEGEALRAIEEAWQACVGEPEDFELRARQCLSELLAALLKNAPRAGLHPSAKAVRDGARIKLMLEFMQTRLGEPLQLRDIAAAASLSESECLRCFRATIGDSPLSYLKTMRLQKAAEELAGSDARITDIALRCGFYDMSYFARSFAAAKGMSPREFRAMLASAGRGAAGARRD